MRLIPPVLPGVAFFAGAAAEVGVLLYQAALVTRDVARDVVPMWVQLIPVAIVFGIGGWGLLRLFQHERETDRRFRELERQTEERSSARHQENVATLAAINEKLDPLCYLLLGVQGQGGLMADRSRLPALEATVAVLDRDVASLQVWAARMGDEQHMPYDPPPRRGRRREDTE